MHRSTFSHPAIFGAFLLTILGALAGCGSGGEDSARPDADNDAFDVTLAVKASAGVEENTFVVGENLVLEVTITNRTGSARVLTLPTSQIYDLAVLPDGAPTPRWKWSTNRVFGPGTTTLNFAARQSITYPVIWPGVLDDGTQMMAGTYQVRGTLAYENYQADWRSAHALAAPTKTVTITN